tara:strand:- start:427 stop:1245 length:819 start_codon:yes stop_codon:yes gene_type:complete
MNALKIFPCGLTTHPLLFGTKNCSAVIGGYYNGITLDRYLSIDLNSCVHLFEASELQRSRLLDKLYDHQRVRVVMGALSGSQSLEPLIFNDFARKTELHNGRYGYGGLKDKTNKKITNEGYQVNPINLRYYLDIQLQRFQNHIHLDIEGAEVDVLKSFGKDLKKYAHQISLELEPSEGKSLLAEYIKLHEATNEEFACLIIDPNKEELLGLKHYEDILSDYSTKSIHVYMVYWKHLEYLKLRTHEGPNFIITILEYQSMMKKILEINQLPKN